MMNMTNSEGHTFIQFLDGPLTGQLLELTKLDTRIGSNPHLNDIVIPDPSILPLHARIRFENDEVIIEGFTQSAVVVNRQYVARASLHDGDEVALGESGGTFRLLTNSETQKIPPISEAMAAQAAQSMETTRYLCTAAHLDDDFREYVLQHIVEEEHRALGESYGVDIIPVVKWSMTARKRAVIRDSILCGILVLAVAILLYSFVRDVLPLLTGGTPGLPGIGGIFALFPFISPFGATIFLIGTTVVEILLIALLSRIAPPRFQKPLFLGLLLLFFYWLIPYFVLAWLVLAVERGIKYYGAYAARLAKGRFRSDSIEFFLDPRLETKLKENFGAENSNVVVYSQHSPFNGAGMPIGEWSFAVDIAKGKAKGNVTLHPQSFRVSELYDYITTKLQELDLSELSVDDRLYVSGQAIRDDQRFLYDAFSHPYTQVDASLIEQFKEDPTQDIRYYKCIRVTPWQGELVLSIFVRFTKVGQTLFGEANYRLLPPVKEACYEIDTLDAGWTVGKIWNLIKQTFLETPVYVLRSPVKVFDIVCHRWLLSRRHKITERLIKANPTFDYGAPTSLRQAASSAEYRSDFQRLDKEMYVKIIERQLLESISSFIDAKNIDTTDLKERQEYILNNGTMRSGDK